MKLQINEKRKAVKSPNLYILNKPWVRKKKKRNKNVSETHKMEWQYCKTSEMLQKQFQLGSLYQ